MTEESLRCLRTRQVTRVDPWVFVQQGDVPLDRNSEFLVNDGIRPAQGTEGNSEIDS